jgi:hypothetical protein
MANDTLLVGAFIERRARLAEAFRRQRARDVQASRGGIYDCACGLQARNMVATDGGFQRLAFGETGNALNRSAASAFAKVLRCRALFVKCAIRIADVAGPWVRSRSRRGIAAGTRGERIKTA